MSVPVTEPGTGTSSGDRAWYRLQIVTEPGTGTSSGDRAWYRLQIVTEPGTGTSSGDRAWYRLQIVTEPGSGTGTGFYWWFRYRFRYQCEIQFRSGPIKNIWKIYTDTLHNAFVNLSVTLNSVFSDKIISTSQYKN